MMHTVPKELRGATLGAAHQWVRSQTDAREYVLKNPSGETISLAELTNGSVVEVDIVGGVKKNPAHPATFTAHNFGINNRVNLTHILPEEVSPALVSAMVKDHGLFGAVQSLSMLMSRPLKEDYPVSVAAEEILRARSYSMEGSVLPLRNPAPYGFGRSYGGRFLGQEIATEDEAMRKYVKEAMAGLDSVSLTEGEAKNFVDNSLAPFLLAAESNRRAISYIRQYILPAAKEFDLRKGSLDREFDYMVKHMATDPADFYYGKEFAIVAHPGFLFPQYGPVVLPVPSSKKDIAALARINDLFLNAGNPPKYEGNEFIRRTDDSDKMFGRRSKMQKEKAKAVLFMNQRITGADRVKPLSWGFIKNRLKRLDLASILRTVAYDTATEESALASDSGAFVEAFKKLSTKDRNEVFEQTLKANPAVLFVMDIHGMRPRPHDWPDMLVLSMMEILAQNRVNLEPVDMLQEKFEAKAARRTHGWTHFFNYGGTDYAVNEEDLLKELEAGKPGWDAFIDGEYEGKIRSIPTSVDVVTHALSRMVKHATETEAVNLADMKLSSSKASLGDMAVSAVSLAITKHGYEASGEDIKFTMALMVYALQNLGTAAGRMELDGLAGNFAKYLNKQREKDKTAFEAAVADLKAAPPGSMQALTALKALEKALERMG
jgi:hypothetical protein